MARTIHNLISGPTSSVAVVETTGAGGGWAHPGVLSTVRIQNENLDELFAYRVLNNPKIEAINRVDVDLRCKGPRSHFSRTLFRLNGELASNLKSKKVLTATGITDAVELQKHILNIEPTRLNNATRNASCGATARRI